MRGGKRVAHIQIGQRRKLFDQQRFRLLFMGQVQPGLKERLLLRDIADIVQKKNFAVFQLPDHLAGRRAADVVDPPDRTVKQLRKHLRVRTGAVEILIFDVAALMGQNHKLCALV